MRSYSYDPAFALFKACLALSFRSNPYLVNSSCLINPGLFTIISSPFEVLLRALVLRRQEARLLQAALHIVRLLPQQPPCSAFDPWLNADRRCFDPVRVRSASTGYSSSGSGILLGGRWHQPLQQRIRYGRRLLPSNPLDCAVQRWLLQWYSQDTACASCCAPNSR